MTDAGKEYYTAGNALFLWDDGEGWAWNSNLGWIKSDYAGEYRNEGEHFLDEITEPDARKKFPDAFKTTPGGDDDRMDPNELTVEEMSSVAARAMGSSSFEDVVSDNEIPPNRVDHAKRVWDSTKQALASAKPGDQMMLPNEWS